MDIITELKKRAKEVEQKLREIYVPSGVCTVLDESMNYSLFSGGKRLRPVLLLECYRLFGGKDCKSIFLLAGAIEILHNYTLVHDDLPCLDNDDYRRGKATTHKVYGEAIALLTGDALLSLSHDYIYAAISEADNKSLYLTAAKLISELTGPLGTVGGQALEVVSNATDLKSNIMEIINGKTCKLISAAVLAGALVAEADEKSLSLLAKYSQCLGYAFQLSDDLLDEEEKGEIDKKSMVALYGEKYVRVLLEKYIDMAKEALSGLDKQTEFLAGIAQYCAERKV